MVEKLDLRKAKDQRAKTGQKLVTENIQKLTTDAELLRKPGDLIVSRKDLTSETQRDLADRTNLDRQMSANIAAVEALTGKAFACRFALQSTAEASAAVTPKLDLRTRAPIPDTVSQQVVGH